MDAGSEQSSGVDDVTVDHAADAFRDLGDPTRVSIITELVSAHRAGETPLSFAELRHRLDIADSGRFNYHLNQLQPRFVQSVDDGYEPRYSAILAESLVEGVAPIEPADLEDEADQPCVLCDEPPIARYSPDRVTLTCETYDEQLFGMPVPPTVADTRSLAGILEFAETYGQNQLLMAIDGLCPYCWGPIESRFATTEQTGELQPPESPVPTVAVECVCSRCDHLFSITVRHVVSDHPAVAGFHYDRGVDISNLGLLERFAALNVSSAEATNDRATLQFELDDDRLEVVVDTDLEVVEVSSITDGP